jgi:hypothetical protein
MSNPRTLVGSGASVAMILASSLLAVACGGGGGSSPGVAVAPVVDPATGRVGKCPSLSGGAPGYEIGFCFSEFQSGAVAEAVFQNQAVTGVESATATANVSKYDLNLPAAWGGTISLVPGAANITVTPNANAIGSITGGSGIDRFLPAPATDNTSIVDFSNQLGTPRLGSFGLWGRSKLTNELFFGAFAGPSPTGTVTPASFLGGAASSATMNGAAVTWYLRSAPTVIPSGVNPRLGLSAAAQMIVNLSPTAGASNVSGTFSNFFVRPDGVTPTSVGLAPMVFTGTLSNATGQFTGTITGGGTGIVKGTILGNAGEQAVGQFAGASADGRLITGAFGVKR